MYTPMSGYGFGLKQGCAMNRILRVGRMKDPPARAGVTAATTGEIRTR